MIYCKIVSESHFRNPLSIVTYLLLCCARITLILIRGINWKVKEHIKWYKVLSVYARFPLFDPHGLHNVWWRTTYRWNLWDFVFVGKVDFVTQDARTCYVFWLTDSHEVLWLKEEQNNRSCVFKIRSTILNASVQWRRTIEMENIGCTSQFSQELLIISLSSIRLHCRTLTVKLSTMEFLFKLFTKSNAMDFFIATCLLMRRKRETLPLLWLFGRDENIEIQIWSLILVAGFINHKMSYVLEKRLQYD